MDMAILMMKARGEFPAHLDPEMLEMILKTYFSLFKNFMNNTSNIDFKRMAGNLSRYLRYTWTSLNQDAKEILVFTVIAAFEVQGKPLPFQIPDSTTEFWMSWKRVFGKSEHL